MTQSADPAALRRRALPRFLFGLAVTAGLLFGSAGSLAWPMGWVLLGAIAVMVSINLTVLLRVNPAVVAVRLEGGRGAPAWDLAILSALALFTVATVVTAGLDRRLGWSEPLPLWLQLSGLALVAAGDALTLWAMAVNPFFARVVRIQEERGHQTVSAGPYRLVRHPGYSAWLLLWGGILLMLGSPAALIPGLAALLIIVPRTALEDRMLARDLPGYRDYRARVRWRLVPGLW